MVQVDIFWSYGLASGLALAGSKTIKKESSPWKNEVFVGTLLWLSLLFGPSGLYLLWNFPYWETMFVAKTHGDIPAWLVAVFGFTNISQGILGYYVTWKCLRLGNKFAATMQTVWSHMAMLFILVVGWDGTGYRRFFYAGTGEEWVNGVNYEISAFFSSPVFLTLLAMGVVFIPSYWYLCKRFSRISQ